MTVAKGFLDGRGVNDRKVLVGLARGDSDETIAAATGMPVTTVNAVIAAYRRWCKRGRPGEVTRKFMAIEVLSTLLTPEEVAQLKDRAKEDFALLRQCSLYGTEVQEVLAKAIVPENIGLSYQDFAEAVGLTPRAIRDLLAPAAAALGDSRIRLEIGFYLLSQS